MATGPRSDSPAPDERTVHTSRLRESDPQAFPELSEAAWALLREAGEVLEPAAGEVLFEAGDPYEVYVVLAGAVQDFVILFASMRRDGKSLGQMAREEINTTAGFTAMIAILFIMVMPN